MTPETWRLKWLESTAAAAAVERADAKTDLKKNKTGQERRSLRGFILSMAELGQTQTGKGCSVIKPVINKLNLL